MKKNGALLVLMLIYISISPFSFVHLDLARDFRVAFDIVNGVDFPLSGQLFSGRFRLGPVWYYFLAFLIWILNNWICVIVALSVISAIQIPVAYILGKELESQWAGLFFSTLIMIPSWGFFEQLYPSHTMFSSLLAMSAVVCAIRYEKTGKKKYIYIESILFSLALHAHPTVIILIFLLIYLYAKSIRGHGFGVADFVVCVLLFLIPFTPMLYYQATMGFPMLESASSHALRAMEIKDLSKIYTLPVGVLGGTFYISGLIDQGELISWMYSAFIVLILGGVFFRRPLSFGVVVWNACQGKLLVFLLVFISVMTLILLSPIHLYYYTSTLRYIILGAVSLFVVKAVVENEKKYFFLALFAITCIANLLLIKNTIKWSTEGVASLNFLPLADVSSEKTPKIVLPATASVHFSNVEEWLCTANYSSLHGPLGTHLIYSYAIEKKFECPDREIFIAGSSAEKKSIPGYIGIPEVASRGIKNKPVINVGSFRVFEIHKNIGSNFISHPDEGRYPPFEKRPLPYAQGEKIIAPLKREEVLAVTNLSYDFWNQIPVVVEEAGVRIEPFYSDMQMRLYRCYHCDGRLVKMFFDVNQKEIIDVVVF